MIEQKAKFHREGHVFCGIRDRCQPAAERALAVAIEDAGAAVTISGVSDCASPHTCHRRADGVIEERGEFEGDFPHPFQFAFGHLCGRRNAQKFHNRL